MREILSLFWAGGYGMINMVFLFVYGRSANEDYLYNGGVFMDFDFLEVNNKKQIEELSEIAKLIWSEYFPNIITPGQINYMVEKYQSADAIARQISNDGYKYFMVFGNGEVLGYLAVKADRNQLLLSKLYLKKEFRGRGYFNEMLSFAEKIANEKGLNSLYLTVNKHNDNSIAVYLKKGFFIKKEQVTDIGNGFVMDDYVMEKMI